MVKSVVLYYAVDVFGGQCHASAVINWQSQNKICILILSSTLADVHSVKCIITNHYIFSPPTKHQLYTY